MFDSTCLLNTTTDFNATNNTRKPEYENGSTDLNANTRKPEIKINTEEMYEFVTLVQPTHLIATTNTRKPEYVVAKTTSWKNPFDSMPLNKAAFNLSELNEEKDVSSIAVTKRNAAMRVLPVFKVRGHQFEKRVFKTPTSFFLMPNAFFL